MTSIFGSIGRWHGGLLDHNKVMSAKQRATLVELARHETQLEEWIGKRTEATFAIKNHRQMIRRLKKDLSRG